MSHLLLLPLLLSTTGARADDLDALYDLSLEELMTVEIDSASKHAEAAWDIPASVIVLTRADIEAMGYLDLEELLTQVPGFYLIDNYEDVLLGVRGTAGGGIQFLVNGVPQHPSRAKGTTFPERARLNIPIESIDRVEIVRGPMSVIWGNNAFQGSVNIITNDAENHGSSFSMTGGYPALGRGHLRLARDFDDGYVAFNWGLLGHGGVSGSLEDTMSAEQLATLHPDMKPELDGMLGHTDQLIQVSAGYGDVVAHMSFSDMRYGFYALTPGFDEGNQLHLETIQGAVESDHSIGPDHHLQTTVAYSEETYDLHFDVLVPDLDAMQLQRSARILVETEIYGQGTPWLEYILGYRYRRLFGLENRFSLPPAGVQVRRHIDPIVENDVFGQAILTPHSSLQLTAGLRASRISPYSMDEVWNEEHTQAPIVEEAEVRLIPRVAAVTHLGDHHVAKLLWGQAVQDHRQIELNDLERISTLEGVYTAAWPAWSLQLAGFHSRTEGMLRKVQMVDPETDEYHTYLDDSGELRTLGVEWQGRVRPVDPLDLQASLTWQTTTDLANSDKAPGYSPGLLAKGVVRYQGPSLTLALFGHWVGGMHADWRWLDQEEEQGRWERTGADVPGYLDLGANARWSHASGFWVQAHGSNLLGWDIRYPATELVDWEGGGFGYGRRVMLTVGWDR